MSSRSRLPFIPVPVGRIVISLTCSHGQSSAQSLSWNYEQIFMSDKMSQVHSCLMYYNAYKHLYLNQNDVL